MANLLERMSLIVRSKTNALMDMFENPEEVIDQVIVDAKKEYANILKESMVVFANEDKLKENLETLQKDLTKWNTISEKAVLSGNDEDATKALERVEKIEQQIATCSSRLESATKDADALRVKLREIQEQIREMESKSADIKADMANAKASRATSKVLNRKGAKAFAEFDRLAEKAAKERRLAETEEKYSRDTSTSAEEDLEKKYGAGSSASVSSRLEEMKNRLGVS